MEIRKVYAPFSQSAENTGTTPIEGYVDVNQAIYPAVNTGLINEDGEWIGLKSTDKVFRIDAKHEAIPNTAVVLSPQATPDFIDMTGFSSLFVAFKVSNGGNYEIVGVMGPDSNAFANLSPVNPAVTLRGNVGGTDNQSDFENLFYESAETLGADVWSIFYISDRLANQKLLQFKITNNSGAESNIEFASLRVV